MSPRSRPVDYLLALAAIAAVTGISVALGDRLGLPAVALLFLLPVLAVAARGALGAGLLAAMGGALAYNFFLLPPYFTLEVHGADNIVGFLALLAVAAVTGRLASTLAQREAAARERAEASQEAAALTAELALASDLPDMERRLLAVLVPAHGEVRLLEPESEPALPPLDRAAARWTEHNGDSTGHGTATMPAADWSFLPLYPRQAGPVLAVAAPGDGSTRAPAQLQRLEAAAQALGQARARLALEAERRQRRHSEERAELLRTLLASLAHDLRTPLTVLRAGVEEARLAGDPARLEGVLPQIGRLERTVEGLLDAARIDAGAVEPAMEPVDLVDIVQAALADAGPALAGLRLHRAVPPDLPLVRADAVLLARVLGNLLDNAAHHAKSCVDILARREGETVQLAVLDDGAGIPAGQEAAIFDRFTRFAGNDREGSGLGLAIVRGFTAAMGAAVVAANRPEGGAAFRLSLPIAAVPAGDGEP